MDSIQSASSSRARGAMFFAVFGAAWLTWWCLETHGAAFGILAMIATGGLGIFLWSLWIVLRERRMSNGITGSTPHLGRRGGFVAVNAVQWVTIAVAAVLLTKSNHYDWLPAAIILIVGLHFLPLAVMFRYRAHYATGAALILLSIAYPFGASGGPASPIGPLGAGIILWLSAIGALVSSVRTAPHAG